MIKSCALAVVLLLAGCKGKGDPEPAPPPSPSSETIPDEQVAKAASPPPTSALPTPPGLQPPTKEQPMGGFAGFSADGTSFAWVTPGLTGEIYYLKIIAVGEEEPELNAVFPESTSQKELKAKLQAFSPERHAPPADLSLAGDLTMSPPRLVLVRGSASVPVPVGNAPYPPTDGAEIYGVSADGKHVAIHVGGKDVEGALSKGGGNDFHFFFVVALP
jgi:hypothetical protein